MESYAFVEASTPAQVAAVRQLADDGLLRMATGLTDGTHGAFAVIPHADEAELTAITERLGAVGGYVEVLGSHDLAVASSTSTTGSCGIPCQVGELLSGTKISYLPSELERFVFSVYRVARSVGEDLLHLVRDLGDHDVQVAASGLNDHERLLVEFGSSDPGRLSDAQARLAAHPGLETVLSGVSMRSSRSGAGFSSPPG